MPSLTTLEKLGIKPNSGIDGDGEELIDGRWRLDGQLGYGAFGKVYRATDVTNGDEVAIKIFKESFRSAGYLQELGLMFDCEHPNIVKIESFGYTAGKKFIVYELVLGGSLRDYLIRYPRVKISIALGILRETVEGLAFAHRRNVLHRDLKPENILLTKPDWPFGCKLCDFGLSARVEPGESLASGSGSPAYMAPEQFNDEYDHRIDFFSLGVIFYEMLFGRRPFSGDASSISHAHAHLAINLPKEGPEPVLELLRKLLAKSADERYASAEALLEDLKATHSEVTRQAWGPSVPIPRRNQLQLAESWQAMFRGGVDQSVAATDGDLLVVSSGRLCALSVDGSIEVVEEVGRVDRLIKGTSRKTTMAWLTGDALHFLRGAGHLSWKLPPEVMKGAFNCVLDRTGKHLAVVTPRSVLFYRINGDALWKAEIETYGALPSFCYSHDNIIWLATEAPRTQLIALTVEGEKICRTASPGSDVDLLGSTGNSVIVTARGDDKIYRIDDSGFVEAEQELSGSPMSLEPISPGVVASINATHIEVLTENQLQPRGLLEYRYPEEIAVFSTSGLYQIAELPSGSRIRQSVLTDV